MRLDMGCGLKPRGDVNLDVKSLKVPNFVRADAHMLPFRNQAFSKVYMIEVLEHLASPLNALREVRRVLKRNGILVLTTPNAYYAPRIIRLALRGTYSTSRSHIYVWGRVELQNLLRRAGFKHIVLREVWERGSPRILERILISLFPKALKMYQLAAIVS